MLQQMINRFKTSAPMSLPELIQNSQLQEVAIYDDYALMSYAWKVPLALSRILDLMDEKPDLVLLYHFMPSRETDFGQELCYYSYPSSELMYKLSMVADGRKEVTEVTVTVYDSLEVMSFELLDDLNRHDARGTYEERRREAEVIADFS
jgi:hypothetical protein